MTMIRQLHAREVLDSRGRPTVEVEAWSTSGACGRAIVPSGASTGRHEAVELRDGDFARHAGRGVLRAVAHVDVEINAALAGLDADDQSEIDRVLIALDGTPNKARLGANAVLGASLAVAQLAASARGEELYEHLNRLWRHGLDPALDPDPAMPMPMVNMISGGLHAGGNLDIQDVLYIPIAATSTRTALEATAAVYHELGSMLRSARYDVLVGDEWGFGPRLSSNTAAIAWLERAGRAVGLFPGVGLGIAVDVASSHFYDPAKSRYTLGVDSSAPLDADRMIERLADWTRRFAVVSIEDGLAEDDWAGWTRLTARLGRNVQLIGDDLFTTNVERIRRGIAERAGNAVLIKPNQVGTLSETLDAIRTARAAGLRTIVSARSGETEDAAIADLAVATAAGQIKIGSITRSERLAKYNRLLRIEERLGAASRFRRWLDVCRTAPRQ